MARDHSSRPRHPNFKDITGQRFGQLLVLRYSHSNHRKLAFWWCRCDCGNELAVSGNCLRTGNTASCGCAKIEATRNRFIDLTGKRFGRWLVLAKTETRRRRGVCWDCRCDCGTEQIVSSASLASGQSLSCGCWRREQCIKRSTKHGYAKAGKKPPEYNIWCGMIQRCTCPRLKSYADYGLRGIHVCERWLTSFANFIADMGPIPRPGLTLERRDNDGNYCPENCYWATRLEQNNNTRQTIRLEFDGRTQSLSQWARELGINPDTLKRRIRSYGWTVEEALTVPVRNLNLDPVENQRRRLARDVVHKAVAAGRIPRVTTQRCVRCGRQATQYHHHQGYDPTHALDVLPACHKCHNKL